jgi:multicomponent Na+:H+ antiporter subunit D
VFAFWELMAVGSTLVHVEPWQGQRPTVPHRRYLMAIHLLGGVVLFAGITGHVAADRQLVAFTQMAPDRRRIG